MFKVVRIFGRLNAILKSAPSPSAEREGNNLKGFEYFWPKNGARHDRNLVVTVFLVPYSLNAILQSPPSPTAEQEGSSLKTLNTFACKMAQAKARIWP
jgi:hypothetical protein